VSDETLQHVWQVVCTDRGQHGTPRALGSLYARAYAEDGSISELYPVPPERAENLGQRTRAARRDERTFRRANFWVTDGPLPPRNALRVSKLRTHTEAQPVDARGGSESHARRLSGASRHRYVLPWVTLG